jgi:hypothetical protein
MLMVECPLCHSIFEVEDSPKNIKCPSCQGKIGYWDDVVLRAMGNTAILRKGVDYHSMRDGNHHTVKRLYSVKIDHWLNGSQIPEYDGVKGIRILTIHSNPTISWAGSGHYWCRADINQDLEIIEERRIS